ncbi:acyl-CoA dehydrogenase-related protein [Dorcoceras hygrometricum]|uniref:Acyl-CoA dehydrogenase-related protein n=1 Tax=Dorcoceras hygrometricum TaxID=472368 RepID=A0A2Z7BJX5_9LAMI|nr:acyl-CoA dehydrogenase-related protein [Dorcoceras hygrometricum]
MTFIGCLSGLPCWHLCLAPTGITRIRLLSVDCGSLRQSGPRPDPRLLHQAALEALTRSARTDSPCRTGRKQISGDDRRRRVGGGGGVFKERRGRLVLGLGLIQVSSVELRVIMNSARRCPTLAQSSSASSGRRRPAPEQRNSIGRPLSREAAPSVARKWVYLVTLAMSLFDLQDVCIAIGSLATLDLPMVVDLIGIYGLKGPYCTLTMTNWFLQALSVIPRGSWRDVARRFTMIHWGLELHRAQELLLLEPPECLDLILQPVDLRVKASVILLWLLVPSFRGLHMGSDHLQLEQQRPLLLLPLGVQLLELPSDGHDEQHPVHKPPG